MKKMANKENNRYRKRQKMEAGFKAVFFGITSISIVVLFIITGFLIFRGVKPFVVNATDVQAPNLWTFLTGTEWMPQKEIFGIGFMIVGSVLATLGAIILAIPMAILTSSAIAELFPKKLGDFFNSIIELLAGIPSVIYGVFGLGLIVPYIAKITPNPEGQSLLAVILVLFVMILPTVVSISVSSIKAVPKSYREASYALGASKVYTTFKVVVPAARNGIVAGIILGIGRAIGETMAIILVAGNIRSGLPFSMSDGTYFHSFLPEFLFEKIRPLTANIALELSYASGTHSDLLFSTGLVLFIFIFLLNLVVYRVTKEKVGG